MPDSHDKPSRVFISYSHDSPEHKARVRALADRLRGDGVDCEIDQYEPAPAEGWPRWMRNQVAQADYVVVVCTEPYQRRAEGHEEPGRGRGATWEGAVVITQELYDAQGRNTKFIPVYVGDDRFVPYFLRPTTRYDVGTEEGYADLLRRLTNQPAVSRPSLGVRRELAPLPPDLSLPAASPPSTSPPAASFLGARSDRAASGAASVQYMFLLEMPAMSPAHLVPAERIVVGEKIEAVLRPDTPAESAFLTSLRGRGRGGRLAVAYHQTAAVARVVSATQRLDASGEAWDVMLEPEASFGGSVTEMATTGHSADDIAELRARRILLDERLGDGKRRGWGQDMTLDMLVRGLGGVLQAERSPFPMLYAELGRDEPRFLAAARLAAVLWLRLTSTVDRITRLDLALDQRAETLSVDFEGIRARYYTNVEPLTMEVRGNCPLTDP